MFLQIKPTKLRDREPDPAQNAAENDDNETGGNDIGESDETGELGGHYYNKLAYLLNEIGDYDMIHYIDAPNPEYVNQRINSLSYHRFIARRIDIACVIVVPVVYAAVLMALFPMALA